MPLALLPAVFVPESRTAHWQSSGTAYRRPICIRHPTRFPSFLESSLSTIIWDLHCLYARFLVFLRLAALRYIPVHPDISDVHRVQPNIGVFSGVVVGGVINDTGQCIREFRFYKCFFRT
jgi:hypothetical protein